MHSNIHCVYILIFVAFCLLSVTIKQWLKQQLLLCTIRAPDQTLDRFFIINMEFLSLWRRDLSWQNTPNARSKERQLFLLARKVVV